MIDFLGPSRFEETISKEKKKPTEVANHKNKDSNTKSLQAEPGSDFLINGLCNERDA